ncbi:MAG: hypothetical protein ABW076_15645 [Candidatus Thiodiazotropha sp.]
MNPGTHTTDIRPNTPLLALLSGLAIMIGATPYLFYIDKLWLLPLLAVGSIATMWISARKFRTHATFEPTPGEWISAGWGFVGYASMQSLNLVYYGIAYWIVRGIVYVAGLMDFHIDPSWAHSIGLWVSLLFALGLYVAVLELSTKLPQRLYPRLAGVRSPYYALWFRYKLWILLAVVTGLSGLAVMVILGLHQWYWVLAAWALVFYTSFPIASMGEEREQLRAKGLKAARKLLEATGWSLSTLSPTGDPQIDPFLEEVDYLARREAERLLIGVVAAEVDWTAAASLQMAARVLQGRLPGEEEDPTRMHPLLFLTSETIDDSVQLFAEREDLVVVHLPKSKVKEVLQAAADPAALKNLADALIPYGDVNHGD